MSTIQIRGDQALEYMAKLVQYDGQVMPRLKTFGGKYINCPDRCLVCFQGPEIRTEPPHFIYQLIKHHISYFPEVIAFVHYDCHKKIHNMPLLNFFQYRDGDSRKFYELMKKVRRVN